ncbi:MAG: prepilin peptidase [Bacilli bacterium]|nr:prepilin peptidase [Bacilli bacterium]
MFSLNIINNINDFLDIYHSSLLLKVVVLTFLILISLCIGSFLNVLIYRLPINESLTKKNSHCPKCGHMLKWYENIPLLSYIIQRGRCRGCKELISIQYPIIEFLSVCAFIIAYSRFNLSLETFLFTLILQMFIVIFMIDLKHQIIPDSINVVILVIGLLSLIIPHTSINQMMSINYIDKIIGFGVAILILIVFLLLEKLLNKELMGGGDLKLFFGIGLFMGWQLLILGIFIASVIAVIVEMMKKVIKSEKFLNKVIPFGPYLVMGFAIVYVFGLDIISLYLSLFN